MLNARNLSQGQELGGKSSLRTSFISRVVSKVEEKVFDECMCNEYVKVRIDCKSGTIEVYMNREGDSFVDISHDGNNHESPMIAEAIEKALPDWADIEAMAEIDEDSERRNRDYLRMNSRKW